MPTLEMFIIGFSFETIIFPSASVSSLSPKFNVPETDIPFLNPVTDAFLILAIDVSNISIPFSPIFLPLSFTGDIIFPPFILLIDVPAKYNAIFSALIVPPLI